MRIILKQTVVYQESEDRLLLLCQFGDGLILTFWLTRRLADRLVSALFQYMETSDDLSRSAGKEALVTWENPVAKVGYSEPVSFPGEGPRYLIESIDIAPLADGRQLLFRARGCDEVCFALDGVSLHQWMVILHRMYLQANWNAAEVWPSWFDPAQVVPDIRVPLGTVFH